MKKNPYAKLIFIWMVPTKTGFDTKAKSKWNRFVWKHYSILSVCSSRWKQREMNHLKCCHIGSIVTYYIAAFSYRWTKWHYRRYQLNHPYRRGNTSLKIHACECCGGKILARDFFRIHRRALMWGRILSTAYHEQAIDKGIIGFSHTKVPIENNWHTEFTKEGDFWRETSWCCECIAMHADRDSWRSKLWREKLWLLWF